MAFVKIWAGRAWGTNIGLLYVTLEGDDANLTGILRMNEQGVGIFEYDLRGAFSAPAVQFAGLLKGGRPDLNDLKIEISGKLNAKGEIHGEWHGSNGSAGPFVLHPQTADEQAVDNPQPAQFHTARHSFGAIEINRSEITRFAENIALNFSNVIITVVAGTEQARYLQDFKNIKFSTERADILKIFATKPDGLGSNQVVSIELGPQINSAMTQGANEAWVLGQLETIKRDLKNYERVYVTNFKRWGIGINQFLILCTIVFLPSLSNLFDRSVLMIAVVMLIFAVNWLHSKYIPFSTIYLEEKRDKIIGRLWPSFVSWIIGIAATVIAALLGAYLKGWLKITQ